VEQEPGVCPFFFWAVVLTNVAVDMDALGSFGNFGFGVDDFGGGASDSLSGFGGLTARLEAYLAVRKAQAGISKGARILRALGV
jgi:hypothetical protein